MNAAKVEMALMPLVGLEWWGIGRAVDLLWLSFGEKREVAAWGGGTKKVGEWAIHVQCTWRFRLPDGDIVSKSDLNIDSKGNPVFDKRDQLAQSRFDDVAACLREKYKMAAPKIISVQSNERIGLTMDFSDGGRFEVIPDSDGEAWRLFNPSTGKPHFVVKR